MRAAVIHGTHHHVGIAGSNLQMTASVFQAWETLNYGGLQFVRRLMSSKAKRCSEQCKCQAARKRSRQVIGRTFARGKTSLQELCFARACLEDKRAMLEVLPEQVAVDYMQKKRASRILDNFLRCLSVSHKSANSGPETHLLLMGGPTLNSESSIGGNASSTNAQLATRTIWEPAKLSLRMFYRLVCMCSGGSLVLRKESRWDEMRHALYCLWLINPAILTLLTAVFVIGDLGIPFLKNKLRRLILWILKVLPARFSNYRKPKHLKDQDEN